MTLQDWKRTQSTASHGIRTRMVQCRWEATSATVYPLWHPCALVLHMTTPHWVGCTRSLTDCVYITLCFTVDILFITACCVSVASAKIILTLIIRVNVVWGWGGTAIIYLHHFYAQTRTWNLECPHTKSRLQIISRTTPCYLPQTTATDPLLPASSVTTLLLCDVPQWVPTLMSSTWSTPSVCRSSQSLLTTCMGQLVLEKTLLAIRPHI